jgi:hypothetical protein
MGIGMPPDSFRLNFLDKVRAGDKECWLNEIGEAPGTPGRAADGQMWFCLTCIENLYNGVGLLEMSAEARSRLSGQTQDLLWRLPNGEIEAEWAGRLEKAIHANSGRPVSGSGVEVDLNEVENSESGSYQPETYESPEVSSTNCQEDPMTSSGFSFIEMYMNYGTLPNRDSWAIAPGLNPFAVNLSSFIRPETRYTLDEFYTLNSYEYFALMKWKNMCTRKTMWEIPSNRAFCTQISGITDDYDFVNFFDEDILDRDEPEPGIVLGEVLNVQPVSADDISTVKCYSNSENALEPVSSTTGIRELKPLSEIMELVDKRVKEAWQAMDPPFVPSFLRRVPHITKRAWPPHCFWADYFQRRVREQKEENLQRIIDRNNQTISALMKTFENGDGRPNTSSGHLRQEKRDSVRPSPPGLEEGQSNMLDEVLEDSVMAADSEGQPFSGVRKKRPYRAPLHSQTSVTSKKRKFQGGD